MADDLVLSSVHVGAKSESCIGESTFTSVFNYWIKSECNEVTLDDDGDLDVPRQTLEAIIIDHTMATPLENVGTQVWSAALIMGDYILHNKSIFQDGVVLELGSGCGLIGILASKMAKHCYCTDVGDNVLGICQKNIDQNNVDNVSVRCLDWLNPKINFISQLSSSFSWRLEDLQLIKNTSVILATDVIYQDHLTSAFFTTIIYLCTKVFESAPVILLSTEKRINFTLEELAPSSPAHQYFMNCLEATYLTDDSKCVSFESSQLLLSSLPQSFDYERVNELEIWQIKVAINKASM
jgi:predicted nicotinamide N-methyase